MDDYLLHHITDLHAGASHYRYANRNSTIPSGHDGHFFLDCYARYLERCDPSRIPSLILVSGDLTSFATEDEFQFCKDFFDKILEIVERRNDREETSPRLCVVPGNHDVDWTNAEQDLRLNRFKALLERFGDRVLSPFSSSKPYHYYEEFNLLVYLFDSCSLGGVADEEIKALINDFERCESALSEQALKPFRSAIDKLEKRVSHDPGIVPVEAMDALSALPEGHDSMVKVAIVHHNPSVVPSLHLDQYDVMVNGGVFKERLARSGFDVVLHGHRHFQHCAYEEYLRPENLRISSMREGLYVVGAGALGSSENSEFFEISVSDAELAHGAAPPSSIMKVLPMLANAANMNFDDGGNSYKLIIDKPVYSGLRHIQEALRRKDVSNKPQVRDALKQTLRPTIDLKALVDDWQDGGWQVDFNDMLPSLSAIYGVDTLGPDGWILTHYLDYMLVQFQARLGRSGKHNESTIPFSAEVFDAVSRTSWQPRSGAKPIKFTKDGSRDDSLEIVRILIWEKAWLQDQSLLSLLRMIESVHQLASTPVFVLLREDLPLEDLSEEFVIGIGDKDQDLCAYVFREHNDKPTVKVTGGSKVCLRNRFRRFLNHEKLKCLGDFIGDE
ncbi:metallophosphoesterase family protein [Neorhodopirellula lusitana]|uniref:metallophosphoesterase family protein n=1 Tax=Neorhodopirellula lusitana TaxID=445327 RepID=UPI00384CCFE9